MAVGWMLSVRSLALGACILAGGMLLSLPETASAVLAPTVVEESVLNVSTTSATLHACVNPNNSEPTYKFELGTQIPYTTSIPAVPGSTGSCFGGVGVRLEAHVQNLSADTLYDYRAVAVAGTETTNGIGQKFTTQSAAGALTLPDGRAWELVSPATKDGALIPPFQEGGEVIQAAENGGAITYTSVGPVEAAAGNSNETQVLSVRQADGGWSSQDISTAHKVATNIAYQATGQEYKYFSSELASAFVEPFEEPAIEQPGKATRLSPEASELTVYLRANIPFSPGGQGIYGETVAQGSYLPLVTGCPALGEQCKPSLEEYANVPPGTEFGGKIFFEGATTDLDHIIIHSLGVPLTAKTPEGNATSGGGMWEWAGGQLQIVSVLPSGEQGRPAYLGGREGYNARGAISSDGSRIVWSTAQHLYMRDVSNDQTVQLDAFQGGGGENFSPDFQFADSDGSKVFFTDEAKLTAGSTAAEEEPDLYECAIVEGLDGELSCILSDLTVDLGGHASVQGKPGVVLAGSDDSSYIYFVAKGKLTKTGEKNVQGEEAEVGEDNLYMLHYDEEKEEWEPPVFIAVLSEEDSNDWGGQKGIPGDLEGVTSRVSPNGRYLVFMSDQRLTEYNNADASSGEAEEEVYLFTAASDRLVCVSCNPTGERPAGVLDSIKANGGETLLVDGQKNWLERGLAGSVPGWTAMKSKVARYQSRYLSNDGRVFFDSADTLVPQDTNGRVDVYEYEPANVGGERNCKESSSTFSELTDGCVALISSGSSNEESVFLDASGTGPGGEEAEDVFFLTSAPLVPADKDTAFDVYDARVCSGSTPCSPEVVLPPSCATESSCKAAPSPQPSIFGASGSATFSGTGNLAPLPSSTVPICSKGKKLSHGKCIRVKIKNKKKAKARKANRNRRGKR